jgi:hypothetical protein
MGVIADGILAYAQPLIDQTDGSTEDLNRAFAISQVCFNLALLPEEGREKSLGKMQSSLEMDDEEFAEFRRSIVDPMIRRHEEMFPLMHRRVSGNPLQSGSSLHDQPKSAARDGKSPGIDRYAPCPCNSGEKYKFCCGAKGKAVKHLAKSGAEAPR